MKNQIFLEKIEKIKRSTKKIMSVQSKPIYVFGSWNIFLITNETKEFMVCECPDFVLKGSCKHINKDDENIEDVDIIDEILQEN